MDYIHKKRAGTLMDSTGPGVRFLPRGIERARRGGAAMPHLPARTGGTWVQTKGAGPVQFGLPPETIKDCMAEGLTLPTHYVLPKERFNLQVPPSPRALLAPDG